MAPHRRLREESIIILGIAWIVALAALEFLLYVIVGQ